MVIWVPTDGCWGSPKGPMLMFGVDGFGSGWNVIVGVLFSVVPATADCTNAVIAIAAAIVKNDLRVMI